MTRLYSNSAKKLLIVPQIRKIFKNIFKKILKNFNFIGSNFSEAGETVSDRSRLRSRSISVRNKNENVLEQENDRERNEVILWI